MKILVTGANGQLGMSLRKIAGDAPHRFLFTDVTPGASYLDITDLEAVRSLVGGEGIEAIVNCAAFTNVDAAEDNEALAETLNAKAVENLAAAMKEVNGLLVHISTDYVFGGKPYNTPLTEELEGIPTGAYGRTKLHGEQAILRSGVRHIIIRTAWLYSEYGKNFVKTILRLLENAPTFNVVYDQVGTPTYAGDLARAIMDILRFEAPDKAGHLPCIYHFSDEGVCSWYDFAQTIARLTGRNNEICPCRSDEFPSKVHRPAYSVLDKTKIKETFGLRIPYWADSLRLCLERMGSRQ